MIDAHIHLSGGTLHPATLEEGDRLGVQKFVGSSLGRAGWQHYPTLDEIQAANDDMFRAVQEHPDRIAAYCYVNPRHGEKALIDFRRRQEDEGFIGLKLWVATLSDDPAVYPFIEQAIAYQAPILIHSWQKTVGQLPYETSAVQVAALAKRYPEARIIMAHFGGAVEQAMNTVAPYRNVNVDTSGTPIGGGEVSIAVQRVGADRVIFGSDLHGACLASNIGKVYGANLSKADTDLVLGGNMEKLLNEVIS